MQNDGSSFVPGENRWIEISFILNSLEMNIKTHCVSLSLIRLRWLYRKPRASNSVLNGTDVRLRMCVVFKNQYTRKHFDAR